MGNQDVERLRHQIKELENERSIRKQAEALLTLQRDLAISMSSERDMSRVWNLVFDTLIQIESIDCGGAYLIDYEKKLIELVATRKLTPAFIELTGSFGFDSHQAKIVFEKKPVYQPRSSFPVVIQDDLKSMGLECLIVLPIIYQDEVIAVLNLASFSREQIPQQIRSYLESIAAQIGGTIARIRAGNELVEHHASLERRIKERTVELERTRDLFSKLFEQSPIIMALSDIETGLFLEANDSFLRNLGFRSEEVVGKTNADLNIFVNQSDRDKVIGIVQENGFVLDYEIPIHDKYGNILYGLFSAHILKVKGKSILLTTMVDITQLKQAQEERLKLERQIIETQKRESLGVLAGGIAHDFNNLLVGVLGNADLALSFMTAESTELAYIEDIKKSALLLSDLTNQMLAYSGKGSFIVKPVHLAEIVQKTKSILAVSVPKTITIQYDLADDLPLIKADASQMQQVTINLIINAVESIGEQRGEVSVRTGLLNIETNFHGQHPQMKKLPKGHYVFLEVQDTGCGIDKETQNRIFDPFYSTKFTGRGLGLAVVQGIVQGHEGSLLVDSSLEQGSRFTVLFPSWEGLDQTKEPVGKKVVVPTKTSAATILLVDDEEVIRGVARRMIEHLGHSVVIAKDGFEALSILRQLGDSVNAVILDWMMPKMNGIDTLAELHKIRPDLPVLLSSGFSEDEARTKFSGSAFVGFIHKPYRLQTLEEKLQNLLTR